MQGSKRVQLILIGAGLLAGAGIYFAPHKSSENISPKGKEVSALKNAPGFEGLIADAKKAIPGADTAYLAELERKAASNPGYYDSLALQYDRLQRPAIAAYYFELKSRKEPSEKNYLNAAYRFFDAYKSSPDSIVKSMMVQKAIAAYLKVIEINPANLDAKTDLGVLYAEGTAEPMKGITLLREVVSANPAHENAQLNLGYLSVKSGQYAKAIERFEKVYELNPKRVDMLVLIAQVYDQMGDKQKAIAELKKFQSLSSDESLKKEVQDYIHRLEN